MNRSLTAVLTTAVLCVALGVLAVPALAHETATAGDLALEVGWGTEPAYVGQLNSVQLIVTHKADGDPINDPGARLTATGELRRPAAGVRSSRPPTTRRPAPGRPASTRPSSSRRRPATTRSTSPGRWRASRWISKVTSSPKTFSPVEDASAAQFPVKVPGTDQVAQRLDKELSRVATADDVSSRGVERQDARLRGHRRRRRRRACSPPWRCCAGAPESARAGRPGPRARLALRPRSRRLR